MMPLANTQRVLIYRLGSLGDSLVALPAFRLLKNCFPSAERRVLTNFSVNEKAAPMAALLDGTGLIDGYIRYPVGLRNVKKLLELAREIRAWKPDLLIYMQEPRGVLKAWRDAIFFRACGIRRIVGIPFSPRSQSARFDASSQRYEHKTDRMLRRLIELGEIDASDGASWNLGLTDPERRVAKTALKELAQCQGVIAASIGAKVDVKDWEDKNWSALLKAVSRELPGWGLAVIGAPSESPRTEQLLSAWNGPAINLCGKLSVRESAAVLELSNVYVGHDSGPMHLAAAVGTPCVAIFSSRNLPGEWFPYGDAHTVFYNSVECRGCALETCGKHAKKCILGISSGEVASAVVAKARRARSSANA